MTRTSWLHPKAATVLRWLAFPPAVFLIIAVGMFTVTMLQDGSLDLWMTSQLTLLVTATAVYAGSRVAPAARLTVAVPLTAGLLVWFAIKAHGEPNSSFVTEMLVAWMAGIGIGVLSAVLRARADRLQQVRSPGKPQRYKGTTPFQGDDVDRRTFFGRERETRSLLSLVLAERLVVLFGKSGMGKSSLINAGLAEPLRERGFFPMTVRLSDRSRPPVDALLDGVRAAANAAGVEIVAGDATDPWTFFKSTEFWSDRNDLLQPLLILDQFEELFTLHTADARREFFAHLGELVRGRGTTARSATPAASLAARSDGGPPKLKILLTLREDYLADLEELAGDIPGVLQHRFRLGPLTAESARDAIVKPAALENAAFDTAPFTYREDAVQRILAFLASRRRGTEIVQSDDVEPSQLQLICQYVEEQVRARPGGRTGSLRVEVSEADLGGEHQLQRILEDFYDRTLASIGSRRERRRIQRLCERRLISAGGRRLTEAEEEIEQKHGVSKQRLRELVDARLLRPEPRLGGMFFELSHDTLVGPILRSRKKRVARNRRLGVAAAVLLVAYFAPWWVFAGRQNSARQRVLALSDSPLRDRNDPDVLLDLPRARMREVEQLYQDAVRTRKGYAATLIVVDEIARQFPELAAEARALHDAITGHFNGYFGLAAIDAEQDQQRNPRILIAGGGIDMAMGGDDTTLRHVTVSPFRMQEHEVTNAEYRRFDPNHDRGAPDDHPAVHVSWHEAAAYAAWLGGSLPTEAQWELAARGTAGRTYPWGEDEPTCELANYSPCGYALAPVKSRERGKTPEGVYDLAGNAAEWCGDLASDYAVKGVDPRRPATGFYRALRGGEFRSQPNQIRAGARHTTLYFDSAFAFNGFRVAWPAADERAAPPAPRPER